MLLRHLHCAIHRGVNAALARSLAALSTCVHSDNCGKPRQATAAVDLARQLEEGPDTSNGCQQPKQHKAHQLRWSSVVTQQHRAVQQLQQEQLQQEAATSAVPDSTEQQALQCPATYPAPQAAPWLRPGFCWQPSPWLDLSQQQQQWQQPSQQWQQQQHLQQQRRCKASTPDRPELAEHVSSQQSEPHDAAFRMIGEPQHIDQAAPRTPGRLYPVDVNMTTKALRWTPPQLQQHWEQQQRQQQAVQPSLEYPVHAVHLAGEIDILGFANDYLGRLFEYQLPLYRDHVLLELKDGSENRDLLKNDSSSSSGTAARGAFMVIYRYGSVILINVRRSERDMYFDLLKPYIKVPKGQPTVQEYSNLRSDETTIAVQPNLSDWSKLENDKVVVQTLDAGNMRVISHVLSQSVALDYFNSRVDAAIQQFTPYLTAVAQTGACDNVKEARLLQLIADNSLLYTDVVTKFGLLDISLTAWNQDKHFQLWESLRRDYEIERRFDAINRKLGPMLENAKFLLDVRAEQKSSGAEWIIIGLIMLEVLMNGFGHLATFMWHG